jgi:exosortase
LLGLGYAMPQMHETLAPSAVSSNTKPSNARWFLLALVLGVLWVELVNQLRAEWWLNPQYNYGLIVPVLTVYLLWKRWRCRPAATEAKTTAFPVAVILVFAALFLPIRFLAEANPDWRLLSWLFASVAVAISVATVYLIGGRSWRRHFAFPFLFFLVAVPWPVRIEQVVIQDLMRVVTGINVTFLQLAGIPALQHGNVIEVGNGFIGIEEACSGVRSLQATLMIALFLGEFYFFTPVRRVFLVIAGVVLAFVGNVIRTAVLVWTGTTKGAAALEKWHDPAGLTILMACLFGLWLISLLMLRGPGASVQFSFRDDQARPFPLPPSLLVSSLVWLVLAEVAVQGWYAFHQSPILSSRWAVLWPQNQNDYKNVPIPSEAEGLLRYNEGGGATWHGPDGHQWALFFFRWFPGRTAARFLKVHRPDICLPASGRTIERDNGIRMLAVNGVNLPVRSYRFDDHGVPLHVFYCYWDARSSYESVASAEFEDWSARGRLRAAYQGRREIGAQMFELVVWGYEDDSEANGALARELAEIVRAG